MKLRAKPIPKYKPMPPLRFLAESESPMTVRMNEAKLAAYQSSPAYEALLDSQIDKALKFAGNDEVKIYIDPNDEALINKLSAKHGIDIAISKYPFHGGIRAVIPAKNILIDNSFEKKIAEAKDKFDVDMEVL